MKLLFKKVLPKKNPPEHVNDILRQAANAFTKIK